MTHPGEMDGLSRHYPNITIACDLDGVACDFIGGFVRHHPQLDYSRPMTDPGAPWGWNLDTFNQLLGEMPSGFWSFLHPMPKFVRTMTRWLDEGVNVVFITSRGYHGKHHSLDHQVVRETQEWLASHLGSSWTNRVADPHDRCRLEFSRSKTHLEADLWLEDLPWHLDALIDAELPVICFAHDYNKQCRDRRGNTLTSIESWETLDRIVREWTAPIAVELDNYHLHQSALKAWRNCPHKFITQYYSGTQGAPGQAAMVGSFVHSVLERLFMLKPERRDRGAAKSIATQLPIPPEVEDIREFKGKVWKCLLRYFALQNPSEIEIAYLERRFQTEIEGIRVGGVIDLQYSDGSIADIKTGSSTRYAHADNEHQLRLYALAVREMDGKLPPKAQVIYLNEKPHIVEVRLEQHDLDKVLRGLTDDHPSLMEHLETGEAPTKPNVLCGWCDLATQCSDGAKHIQKLVDKGKMKPHAPALQALGISVPEEGDDG